MQIQITAPVSDLLVASDCGWPGKWIGEQNIVEDPEHGSPSRGAPNPQLPEMPVGAVVDVEANGTVCVGPALKIIDD
jgi:hypothetical protein